MPRNPLIDPPDPGPPTLAEMASFLTTVAGISHHPAAVRVAAWLLRGSEEARALLGEIAALIRDAGLPMEPGSAFEAVELDRTVDRLLAAAPTSDPTAFIDPSGGEEPAPELLRLIEARIRRRRGDEAALQSLAARLRKRR